MAVPPAVWVENLGSAVRHSTIDEVPEYLVKVIDGEIWRDFESKMGPKHNDTFEEFVTSEPLQGIGTTVETLRRLCSGDARALDALDRALQKPHGGEREKGSKKANRNLATGTTKDAALRRLRKDRPDLHERVLADELSAHAAMVEAGYRPRTATVRLDDPARVAEALKRRLTTDQLAQVKELL